MRRYETMVILDPDVSEEDRTAVFGRLVELITGPGGFLVDLDEWGVRKLAYEIKKKIRGYYIRLDFCGTGAIVDELERNLRIDDRFLKFMTILLEEEADVEALKKAAAEKQAEKEARAAQKAAETQPAAGETSEPAAPQEPADSEKAPEPEANTEPEEDDPESGGDVEEGK